MITQEANGALSYRPFDGFSWGISDNFKKVGKSSIVTTLGDKLITLGYNQNIANFQTKYDLNKDNAVNFGVGSYWVDVFSATRDDFVDRQEATINLSLEHQFDPKLSGFAGYGYQKERFEQTLLKNSDSNRYLLGLVTKVPEFFKVTTEVGYEAKEIHTQRHDYNLDFNLSANSLFSTYTKLSFLLGLNRLEPSSRSEYSQYSRNIISAQLEHFLNPKLILTGNLSYERQKFNLKDSISSSMNSNSYTKIYSGGATLKRILNTWLSVDGGYTYTKRDTDFAAEGYTDHRISVGLTANY